MDETIKKIFSLNEGEDIVGAIDVCTYVCIVSDHGGGEVYTFKPNENEIQKAAKQKAFESFGQGDYKYRFIPIGEKSTETTNFTCKNRKYLVIKKQKDEETMRLEIK
jgi:hypothetical protein